MLTQAAHQKNREQPARKQRVREKNERLILRAAEEEFVTFGFKGASMKRIAERADLPRANVHYYFKNKIELYGAILQDIIYAWNFTFDKLEESDDPGRVLASYIRSKVMYSKTHPAASRIFASEIIHGAPHLSEYLKTDMRQWMQQKSRIIRKWIDNGQMDPIEPMHLLFLIWASTQHYADFGVQVLAATNKAKLTDQDFEQIASSLTEFILKGCGILLPDTGATESRAKPDQAVTKTV